MAKGTSRTQTPFWLILVYYLIIQKEKQEFENILSLSSWKTGQEPDLGFKILPWNHTLNSSAFFSG